MCKYVRLHKFLSLDRVQYFGLINDFLSSFFFDIRETTIVKNLTKKMTIFVRSTISLFNGGYIFFQIFIRMQFRRIERPRRMEIYRSPKIRILVITQQMIMFFFQISWAMPIFGLIVICTNLKLLIIILLYKELHIIS